MTFKMLQTANSEILKHLTVEIQSNKLTSQILDVNIVAISLMTNSGQMTNGKTRPLLMVDFAA